MPIPDFQSLLAHPAPAFACFASHDQEEREGHFALLAHVVEAPANSQDRGLIPDCPGANAVRELYALHNGALLFSPRGLIHGDDSSVEGLRLFPLSLWAAATSDAVDLWNSIDFDDSSMPYGRDEFLAIAHVIGASKYIHWVTRGPNAGKVYWWPSTVPLAADDHPLAPTFSDFIELICTQPVHSLNDLLGCYVRYSDGQSDTQWIPKRYIENHQARDSTNA